MDSKTYWQQREEEALKIYIKDEAEYSKELDRIYADMLDGVQKEIDSFYQKYAGAEGITLAEAKKRVSKLDIEKYERKAKKYVKEASLDRAANGGKTNFKGKYFSEKANEEMRLYNATMKINRLEMLKANIGLETIKGHAELESFMKSILQGRTMEELERQAGILGKTIRNNAKMANAIVNGSFKVDKVGERTTFSDRIWQYHDEMKNELSRLLSTGLIQGKNSRAIAKDLKKYWYGNDPKTGGGARYCMERLMRTEMARVQTEAQKQSFVRNGFDMYTFHANRGCCDICSKKDGEHFSVKDMMPGENAPPMHPHCRCSVSAYEDSEEYEAWLDYLSNGGTTEQWNKIKYSETKSQKRLENSAKVGKIKSEVIEFSTDKPYEIKLTRERKKAIVAKGVAEPEPIFAVDTAVNKFATYIRKVSKEAGFYDVALHGRDTSVNFFETPIDAYTLAQIIRQRPDYKKGQQIRLLSCSTGSIENTGDCVAQLLANELGVIVKAPTDILYVDINSNGEAEIYIGERGDGEMKLFFPRT